MVVRRSIVVLAVLVCGLAGTLHVGYAQDTSRPRLTLRDIHASAKFSGETFEGGRWADDGPVITYIEVEGQATDLMSYNLRTGQRTELVNGSDLRAADVGRLIRIEDYAYSRDGKEVLLYTDSERVWRQNTKGFYYVYDLERGTLVPLSDRSKGFQMFAKFSPDGRYVGFVRDRNLFVVDLQTMEEMQLTSDGSEGGIINGTSDWVYEEEFGLRDGWAWSPDGQYIAFFQFDESATRDFVMADLRSQYPELTAFRYPKAGEANSEIRVGVIEIPSGEKRFFETSTWNTDSDRHEYIPRMGWTPEIDGTHYVWLFRMDRDQNDLDLIYGHPEDLSTRVVLSEQSDTWIDVETGFSDLDVGKINYLADGKHFVWVSNRDGYNHLYLYENDGTLVRQVTSGPWDVADFHGIDEEKGMVYFTATAESPLERHLYRVPLVTRAVGADEAAAEPVKITDRSGWHEVDFGEDMEYYIDTYSNSTTPPVVTLHEADGDPVNVLEGNEDLIELVAQYQLPAPEFITVPGADGTELNAFMIKPSDFDAHRAYPMLMYVYGGPGSQEVRDRWYRADRRLWHHYLAEEHDILVVAVDSRGTGGRGKEFEDVTYKQLGITEAEDFIAAAEHLGERPYIDEDRMGIWGWSYGGYMTLMSMLYGDGPSTFDVGMSVAPVTDWRQYDTIYTERYMSTPQKNPTGYARSAPISYADRLQEDQDLLIVHGDLDDNVHLQNTIQMIDALQQANRPFDLMIYPGRNHGISGGNARLHLFTLMTDYLVEHLKDVPRQADNVPASTGTR